MRTPEPYTTASGEPRWKVRYRSGGKESSQTFRKKPDANTFAALLDTGPGGVTEALAWLANKEDAQNAATFADWFDTYCAQLSGIQPRTRADYQAMHRRYFSELDALPLPLITRAHIAGIVNRLQAEGRASKTTKNAVHLLSSVMALAVDEGHIPRNPCKRVRIYKDGPTDKGPRFLTHDEFGALVEATPAEWRPLVVFLVGTGMRWSEATALQGRHVNTQDGTIAVRQAWKRIPGGWQIGPPKSSKAKRTVNPAVMALAAATALKRGPGDFIFTTSRGNVVRHANFYNRVWVPACISAGLVDPRPTIHALRHTHASWLISDGQSLEAVQDQLGHESYETTRKIYAHLLPAVGIAVGRSASAALERALPGGYEPLALPQGA